MRPIPFLLLATASTLGIATAAHADCDNAYMQAEITLCLEEERARADARLNEVYAEAMTALRAMDAALSPEDRGAEMALRAAQRNWIIFRDTACEAEGYLMRGGSGETMVVVGCQARLTEARIADLEILTETR